MAPERRYSCSHCNSSIPARRLHGHEAKRLSNPENRPQANRVSNIASPLPESPIADPPQENDLFDAPGDDFFMEDVSMEAYQKTSEELLSEWHQNHLRQQPRVEDVSDDEYNSDEDEDEDEAEVTHQEVAEDEDDEDFCPDWELPGFGMGDRFRERVEAEMDGLSTEDRLSEYDRLICKMFALKVQENLTESTFAKLGRVFPAPPGRDELPTLDEVRARASSLSGFTPQVYHCCPNSCLCYTGPQYADLDKCTFCGEDRYYADGQPRKKFYYIPLIPRLVALQRNKSLAERMKYRAQYVPKDNEVSDIFDGSLYKNLCGQNVEVSGVTLPHQYFSDKRDIALGLSTDGLGPFRRRKKTSWPLLMFNYNLPPEDRNHAENLLSLGVIPGPKKPKDIDSFVWPLTLELVDLAKGVSAFDTFEACRFALRAYLIVVFGDIPAVSMLMHMKGHNGYSPCRMCEITGLPVPGGHTTLYVPHNRQKHPDVRADPSATKAFLPASLPMRTPDELLNQAREVESAPTATEAKTLSREYGIKQVSLLSSLGSLVFPTSFPYDFMHLVWENNIKNLILHWTSAFKGLDDGKESYALDKAIWTAIGKDTSKSGSTIPSAYGSRVPDIAADNTTVSAEMWSFWTLYIGPV